MSIRVRCKNSHDFQVKDELAGKRIKCPKCSEPISVPFPEQEFLDVLPIEAESMPSFDDSLPSELDWSTLPTHSPAPQFTPVAGTQKQRRNIEATPVSSPHSSCPPSPLALGLVGGGSFLAVVVVGLLAWMTLVPRQVSQVANKNADASEPMQPAATESPTEPPANAPSVHAQQANAQQANSTPVKKDSNRLTKFELDKRVEAFRLPSDTWAFAYDELSGRLAITHEEKGIMIFDVDDLLIGKTEPIAEFPTQGLPRGVCFKRLPNTGLFVFIETGTTKLNLIDVETLEQVDEFPIEDAVFLNGLAASRNPADPFVYFGASQSDESSENRIGRFDLATGTQQPYTKGKFLDFKVSEEGSELVVRRGQITESSSIHGVWSAIVNLDGLRDGELAGLSPLKGRSAPAYWIANKLAVHDHIHQSANFMNQKTMVHTELAEFIPHVYLKSSAKVFGLGTNQLIFGSANDFQRFETILLPEDWRRKQWRINEQEELDDKRYRDPRYRPGICIQSKSAFYDAIGDETRNLVVAVFGEHLVIAPLARLKLPDEKLLVPNVPMPPTVRVGELVELNLQEANKDMSVRVLRHSHWLGQAGQAGQAGISILGGKPSARSLKIQRLDEQSDKLYLGGLDDYKVIEKIQYPFYLRIGPEVIRVVTMTADERKNRVLQIDRSREMLHQAQTAFIVDETGNVREQESTQPEGTKLSLMAEVNPGQDVILISGDPVAALANKRLPALAQLGDERMLVVGVETRMNAFKVNRNHRVLHKVSETMILLDEQKAEDLALPKVQNGILRWKPSMASLGMQNVRFEATQDDMSNEWIWPVVVVSSVRSEELPFYVHGIAADYGSSLAVVWGRPFNPTSNEPPADFNAIWERGSKSVLGIYDLEKKELLRRTLLNLRIQSAVMHKSGVYVFGKDVDKDASQKSDEKLLRLELQSLAVKGNEAFYSGVTRHRCMLQAIGDEYLAVKPRRIFDPFERENDTLFKIPSLEIVKPFNSIGDSAFGHALHGKVKDGWILNGVLWDSGFKKRKLLLFPSNLLATPDRLDAEDGVVSILTEGPHIGGWSPDQTNRSIGFKMLENSVTLVASDKALYILPQNSPRNNRTLGYKKIPYVLSPPWDDDECIEREWSHPGKTIISENEGNVFTAANGVIYTIPKELVVAKQENFHFEEQQTSFILEAGKVNRVSYTAEGASNYHLKMWYGIPRDMIGENGISRLDAAAVINLESTSGDFDLNLDPQAVVQVALSQLKNLNPNYSPQTVKENQRIVVEHIKAISDDVQAITGKAPRSIPIVAIAQIVAEHHDGTEKAGLLHCFLVEPPIKEIQKTLQGLLKGK